MLLRKWDNAKREYEPYPVPDDWYVTCYEGSMDALINCAHCGKELTYGNAYTSREIHTSMGFGYAVCKECYRKEWERSNASS